MTDVIKFSLGLLPSLAWLTFFLAEDRRRPEPKKLIFLAFAAGALSTLLVLQIQLLLQKTVNVWNGNMGGPVMIFFLAAVEEMIKFAVVYWVVRKRREFDEPIDPMIYMVVAALGFAAVENIASVIRSVNGLELIVLRFIGATLLHGLSSGIIGYWWAKGLMQKGGPWPKIISGLLLATLVHAVFNYLIIKMGPGIFVTLFLIVIAFFILYDFERLKYVDYIKPRQV